MTNLPTDHQVVKEYVPLVFFYPVLISNGQIQPQTQNIIGKKIRKDKLGIFKNRPSASKKYIGQIINGIGHFIKKNHECKTEFDIKFLDYIDFKILGKKKQDYKISTLNSVKEVFEYAENDDEATILFKDELKKYRTQFFEMKNFHNWLRIDYKGDERNKFWFLKNIPGVKSRVVEYNKGTPFFSIESLESKINIKAEVYKILNNFYI